MSRCITLSRRPALRRLALCASGASIACFATPAFAQCVPDSTGTTVTCSGTSSTYSNTNSGITLNQASGATTTGPVILGNSATVNNAGTIAGASGTPAVQVGSTSTVTNTGSITQVNTTAGSSGVTLGDYSTLTNSGTLSAVAGYNVAQFGRGGTFTNLATSPAAVVGNVQFGLNLGNDVSRFSNYNVTYGFTGNVLSSGNTNFYNAGLFTGSIVQTATNGNVVITNDTGGTFTGSITTGDATTLTNNGTMVLTTTSQLNTLLSTLGTTFTNNGALTVGTASAPASLLINGNFSQSATGSLNLFVVAPSSAGAVGGTNYSQVHAVGSNATAALGGTLNLNVAAGFYPTGTKYDVVLADKAVTGTFSSVTGNALTFITLQPVGIVTLASGQQAYELQVVRTQTYAQALAGVGTANQIAVANAFQPLVATASASPTGTVAALIGQVDFLTVAQAQTFFDTMSPAGYLAYANAMRDQTNNFQRQIMLRMGDQNSDHPEQGFWLNAFNQFSFQSTEGQKTKERGPAVAVGYDFSGPHFVLGAAVGYSSDSLRYSPGNLTGKNSATQLAAYGGIHLGPLMANGIVSYQFGNMSTTRTITLGTSATNATASIGNHLLSATGTISAKLDAGGVAFTPFGGVQYSNGSIKSFTETGASVADLSVSSIKANRTDLLVGATLTPSRGTLRPYIKGTYRSAIGSAGPSIVTAYVAGDPTTAFSVTGLPASKHEADVDAGLNIVIEDEGGFFLGYQGIYRDDLQAHAIMAGLRIEFE